MGKGGFFLTFLVVLGLIFGAWYACAPRGTPEPAPPDGGAPEEGPVVPDESPPGKDAPPELPPVTVVGLVLDARSREPVREARVELADRGVTTSDARGVWKMEVARPFATRRITIDGRVSAKGYLERPIGLRIPFDGNEVGARTVLLPRISARVRGRVFFADGSPVEGARVGETVTGADGRFGPVPVGAGRVGLLAILAGHPSGRTVIDVEPGEIRDLTADIWIPESTPYSGVIRDDTGQPLAGARVNLGRGAETVTDEDGAFSFPGSSGGFTNLEFRGEGWRPFRRPIRAGVPLEVTLVKGGILDGVLRKADGTTAGSGYEVSLLGRFDSGEMFRTTTGSDGGFRMTLPVGGPVEIEAMRKETLCGRFVVEATPDSVTQRDFTLKEAAVLTVRVVSAETDAPVPEAVVYGGWPEPSPCRADALGAVEIPLPPRTLPETFLRLNVHHPEHLAHVVPVSSTKFLPGEVLVVKIVPRGTIRVTVRDGSDRPVPGAIIVVSRHGGSSLSTFTGPDGAADAVAPMGRLVSILVTHPQHGVQTTSATAPAEVTLRLARAGRPGMKRILVLDEDGAPIPGAWVQGYGLKRRPVDETGRVEVPAHEDWLHVMAPGRATALVDIEEATAEKEVPVRLAAGRDLQITVVDEKGHGVSRARLHVSDELDRSVPVPRFETDGMGKALVRGLPVDMAVLVSASRSGFAAVRSWVPAEDVSAEIRLPREGVIRVMLAGGRRAGQPFRFRWRTTDRAPYLDEYGSGKEGTVPDASGVLRIAAPPGRIALFFTCAGAAPRIWPDIAVPAGAETEVSYDFPEAGKFDVRVMDDEDAYVDGARIFVVGINEHLGWTASRGRIPDDKRAGLPVGRVRLAISAEGRPTVWTEELDLSVADPVTVVMPAGSVVDGTLVDEAGRAVHGRVRVLVEVDRPTSWIVTDADGTFRLARPLAPGEHRVAIRAPGFCPRLETITIGTGPKTSVTLSVK